MSARLLHSKSRLVDYQALERIPTPASTDTWQPVSHAELVDHMTANIEAHGFKVMREQFAVNASGAKLFGVFDLDKGFGDGMALSVGFRNSHNKTLGIKIVIGTRVFVCDNLALSGDAILIKHKHTSGFNLADDMVQAFSLLDDKVTSFQTQVTRWQSIHMGSEAAAFHLTEMLRQGMLTNATFMESWRTFHFADELVPDCLPRTPWGLHNSITRAFKKLPPLTANARTMEVSDYLAKI